MNQWRGNCQFAAVLLHRCRICAAILVSAVTLASAGCSRDDQRLQAQREALESLGESTAAITEAWLAGDVSGTYTSTALQQVFVLVEQERRSLTAAPATLLDPRGAQLSEAAEQLSRLLAAMLHDVRAANASAMRQHVASIPIRASEPS